MSGINCPEHVVAIVVPGGTGEPRLRLFARWQGSWCRQTGESLLTLRPLQRRRHWPSMISWHIYWPMPIRQCAACTRQYASTKHTRVYFNLQHRYSFRYNLTLTQQEKTFQCKPPDSIFVLSTTYSGNYGYEQDLSYSWSRDRRDLLRSANRWIT